MSTRSQALLESRIESHRSAETTGTGPQTSGANKMGNSIAFWERADFIKSQEAASKAAKKK